MNQVEIINRIRISLGDPDVINDGVELRVYWPKLDVEFAIIPPNRRKDDKRIFADVHSLWYSEGDCPVQLPLPQSVAEVEEIIAMLRFLSTEAGRQASDEMIKLATEYTSLARAL